MRPCERCGQKFADPGFYTPICGNCADDLRQEEEAANQEAIAQADARARWEVEQAEQAAFERMEAEQDYHGE